MKIKWFPVLVFIVYSIALLLVGRFLLQPKVQVETSDHIIAKYEVVQDSLIRASQSLKREISILRDSLGKKTPYIASISEIDSIVKEDSSKSTYVYRQWLRNLGNPGIVPKIGELSDHEIVLGTKYMTDFYYLLQDYAVLELLSEKQDDLILNLESQIAVKDSMINEFKVNLDLALIKPGSNFFTDILDAITSRPAMFIYGLVAGYFAYRLTGGK